MTRARTSGACARCASRTPRASEGSKPATPEMEDSNGTRRPRRNLILAVALFLAVLLGLELWSEREGSLTLPPDEGESVEESF